jgi:hypothetical protein
MNSFTWEEDWTEQRDKTRSVKGLTLKDGSRILYIVPHIKIVIKPYQILITIKHISEFTRDTSLRWSRMRSWTPINRPVCVHLFNEFFFRFSPLSAYTSTSIANFTCLFSGRHVCAENKEIRKRTHNLSLARFQESDLCERHQCSQNYMGGWFLRQRAVGWLADWVMTSSLVFYYVVARLTGDHTCRDSPHKDKSWSSCEIPVIVIRSYPKLDVLTNVSETPQYEIWWKLVHRFSGCYMQTDRQADIAKLKAHSYDIQLRTRLRMINLWNAAGTKAIRGLHWSKPTPFLSWHTYSR